MCDSASGNVTSALLADVKEPEPGAYTVHLDVDGGPDIDLSEDARPEVLLSLTFNECFDSFFDNVSRTRAMDASIEHGPMDTDAKVLDRMLEGTRTGPEVT